MKILVVLEQRNGAVKSTANEALTAAYHITGQTKDVVGLVLGAGNADITKGFGCDRVIAINHDALKTYNPLTYAEAVAFAVEKEKPDLILGMASPLGKDLFARLAARLDAGLIMDATSLIIEGGQLQGGVKPLYSGKVLGEVRFQGAGLKMLTLRPNAIAPKQASGLSAVETLSFEPKATPALKTVEIKKGKSDKPDLTEASVIISGGRSLGSAENFSILHQCADVIGATVGASRAAVDSGYAGHEMQVGQTGKTVNPNLYIACGISGAIQHLAGMRSSKVVVAINTDPEAPIFSIASYGIVGDLFKVVPLLTEAFKKLKA